MRYIVFSFNLIGHQMTLKSVVFYLLILLCLPGCMLKVAYNNLPWIVPWYVSDYVDLESEQEKQFDLRLAEVLIWHRKNQIPVYVGWLQDIRSKVTLDKSLSYLDIESYANDIQQFYQILSQQLAPSFINLFNQLQPQQFEQLFLTLEKDNDEYRKNHDSSKEAQREKRVEKMTERLENWIDDLSDEQIALVQQWGVKQFSAELEGLDQQKRWQAHLKLLTQAPNSKQSKEDMLWLITNPSQIWPAEYARKKQSNRRASIQLIVDIANTLSTDQRQFLIKQLNKYSEELWSIHVQVKDTPAANVSL